MFLRNCRPLYINMSFKFYAGVFLLTTILFSITMVHAIRQLTLSGSAFPTISEDLVIGGDKTIILTLTEDTYVPEEALTSTQINRIIEGIQSNQNKVVTPLGWNGSWVPAQQAGSIKKFVRISDTELSITLVAVPNYDIHSPETITVTIPPDSLTLGVPLTANAKITILHTLTVSIGGTFVATPIEANVVNGGLSIQLTLVDNTFLDLTDAYKRQIIQSLSAEVVPIPVNGWNNQWQTSQLSDLTLVFLSRGKSVCTIIMHPTPNFDIQAIEVITISVPGGVTQYGRKVTATTKLTVKNTVKALLAGSFLDSNNPLSQIDLGLSLNAKVLPTTTGVANPIQSITINLVDDQFISVLTNENKKAIFNNIVATSQSGKNEETGWNLFYLPTILNFSLSSMILSNPTTISIQLPTTSKYRISSREILQVTVPASVIVTQQNVVASSKITINTRIAILSGSFITGNTGSLRETSVRNGGLKIVITLINDSWNPITEDIRKKIINGMQALDSSQAGGWAKVWVPAALSSLPISDMVISSSSGKKNDMLTITMPFVLGFSISLPEYVTIKIPVDAMVISNVDITAIRINSEVSELVILNDPGSATISGSFLYSSNGRTENAVIVGGRSMVITLIDDSFVSLTDTLITRLIYSFVSTSIGSVGWDNWRVTSVVNGKNGFLISDGDTRSNILTITMVPVPSYNLHHSVEVVTLSLPPSLLTSNSTMVASPKLTIFPGGELGTVAVGTDPGRKKATGIITLRIDLATVSLNSDSRGVFVGNFEQALNNFFAVKRPGNDVTAIVQSLAASNNLGSTDVTFLVVVAGDGIAIENISDLNASISDGSLNQLSDVLIVTSLGVRQSLGASWVRGSFILVLVSPLFLFFFFK